MEEITIPIKPAKNEDGSYTLRFPTIKAYNKEVANYCQNQIAQFLVRLTIDKDQLEILKH